MLLAVGGSTSVKPFGTFSPTSSEGSLFMPRQMPCCDDKLVLSVVGLMLYCQILLTELICQTQTIIHSFPEHLLFSSVLLSVDINWSICLSGGHAPRGCTLYWRVLLCTRIEADWLGHCYWQSLQQFRGVGFLRSTEVEVWEMRVLIPSLSL